MAGSPHLLMAYYQQMPPFAGGTAMRGGSVMPALARLWQAHSQSHMTTLAQCEQAYCEVLTMVGDDPGLGSLRYRVVSGSLVKNQSGLIVRLLGELMIGMRAAAHVLIKAPAIVLLSSPGYWPCLLIAAVCRLRSIPYVLDVRDLYPEVYVHSGLLRETSYAYRSLQALTLWWYRGASAIAVATQGLKRIVAPQSLRKDGTSPVIEVVYNGFPQSLHQIRPPKHARFTVVFHGVLGYFQDIETLCTLAERLHKHDIDMVAIGYGKKENLLQTCKAPNLRFLGRMDHQYTMQNAAQCHLGLCLRRDDGISKDAFPVKVWEYLGLGLPSIVTPRCEAGEFLLQQGCGLQMATGDLDTLEAAIVNFRDHPEQLQAMAARCAQAAESYTREQLGQQLAQLVVGSLPVKVDSNAHQP